jgi:hypothetical protein
MKRLFILLAFILVHSFSSDVLAFDYAEAEEDGEEKVWLKHPKREVSIILTDEGYYPEKTIVFKNEKVKFFLTSTSDEAGCMIIDKHQFFVGVKKGRVSEGEVVLEKPGDYKIYCPTSKHVGHLTVLEKKKKKPKRQLASKSKSNIWMPKEY